MERRRYLAGVAGVGAAALAGCLGGAPPDGTVTPYRTPPDWERDTDCDGMHDSVVKVEWVREDLSDNYAPIPWNDLTEGEREIAGTAIREGGYGTCDASDAFVRFVERVGDHRERQARDMVHLERSGRYYGLYVEKQDQVFSAR